MALKRAIRPDSDSPFRISLGPAMLYLDDIRDVYDDLLAFSRQWRTANQEPTQGSAGDPDNPQDVVEIRAQNAIAGSVEDLKDATRKELGHVSLICKSPKMRVDFWLRGAQIIAESDSASVQSYAESLNQFVQGRRNWLILPLAIRKSTFLGLFAVLGYFLVAILLPVPYQFKIYPNNILYVESAVLVAVLVFQLYRQYRNAVKVSPAWRRENRGLSGKTRRDLAIALVSAIVAGFLGLWGGVLAHSDSSQSSAVRSVAQLGSCALTRYQDGNAGPVTCADGLPNISAIRYFSPMHLKVLSLSANPSQNDVAAAICQDFAAKHTTIPIETSAANLAYAEQKWDFYPPSSGDIPGILKNCRSFTASSTQ